MKYILLVGDGMCDYPIENLNNRTPLQVAKTPNMNFMAENGRVGIISTIPNGMSSASDVANLNILGYDPKLYYTGRGPLEAANLKVKLGSDEIAFRCNLITASADKLIDYSSGHISSKEASILIGFLNEKLGSEKIKFYPGTSYRHLLVIRDAGLINALKRLECTPPHDILGGSISRNLPKGDAADIILEIMSRSRDLLAGHEINHVRIDLKENPANMIWLWGQGISPNLPKFKDKYDMAGSVISAVDLIKGIGRLIGLDVLEVPGATGYYDTNYKGKADYAVESLKKRDFVFVHVESIDEASHNGDLRQKIAAIENFDRFVVGGILKHFKRYKNFRIAVLADHATPISLRTHTDDPVFFAIYGKDIAPGNIKSFDEPSSKLSELTLDEGYKLMDYLIKGEI
jgi:2,3-bisphosphoglycerate-independent phosphoglycerate mutase